MKILATILLFYPCLIFSSTSREEICTDKIAQYFKNAENKEAYQAFIKLQTKLTINKLKLSIVGFLKFDSTYSSDQSLNKVQKIKNEIEANVKRRMFLV